MEACTHAAQNELLPLRVVVQVLFFEQARATAAGGQVTVTDLPSNVKALLAAHNDSSRQITNGVDDQWSVSGLPTPKSNISTLKMKLAEDDNYANRIEKSTKIKGNKSKKMFSKLWSINRNGSEKG